MYVLQFTYIAIPADAIFLKGYVLNGFGYVLYVLKGYVLNGYVLVGYALKAYVAMFRRTLRRNVFREI